MATVLRTKACSQMLPTVSAAVTTWKGFQSIYQLLCLLPGMEVPTLSSAQIHLHIFTCFTCFTLHRTYNTVGCRLCDADSSSNLDGLWGSFDYSQIVQKSRGDAKDKQKAIYPSRQLNSIFCSNYCSQRLPCFLTILILNFAFV